MSKSRQTVVSKQLLKNSTPIPPYQQDKSFSECFDDAIHAANWNKDQTATDWARLRTQLAINTNEVPPPSKRRPSIEGFLTEQFSGTDLSIIEYILHTFHQGGILHQTEGFYDHALQIEKQERIGFKRAGCRFYSCNQGKTVYYCELLDVESYAPKLEVQEKEFTKRHQVLSYIAKFLLKCFGYVYQPPPIAKMLTISKVSLDDNNQLHHELVRHDNFILSERFGAKLFPQNQHNHIAYFESEKNIEKNIESLIEKETYKPQPNFKLFLHPGFWWANKRKLVTIISIVALLLTTAGLILFCPPVGAFATLAATKIGLSSLFTALGTTLSAPHIAAGIGLFATGLSFASILGTLGSYLHDKLTAYFESKALITDNDSSETPGSTPTIQRVMQQAAKTNGKALEKNNTIEENAEKPHDQDDKNKEDVARLDKAEKITEGAPFLGPGR